MLGPLGTIGHYILTPLYYAVSGVMLSWHWVFSHIGLDPDGGAAWALSIIGLTLVIRAALIPLFVKQIKASRNMQLIQPKVKELQKKYGHDRERLAQETMALYKETGTNPFASCLPILVQMPIFLALFRLIAHAAKKGQGNGFLTDATAKNFGDSKIFGLLPVSASFTHPDGVVGVQIVAAILVLAMTATTFTTQRQLMSKNMPKDALSGPYAQQQKLLLYVLPVVFAVGGIAFPIGVLLYWTTSNLWTMGQQFYVIRNNPAPGTPAFDAKVERDKKKAQKHGPGSEAGAVVAVTDPATGQPATDATGSAASGSENGTPPDRRPAQRQQPQKKSRSQRRGGGQPAPATRGNQNRNGKKK